MVIKIPRRKLKNMSEAKKFISKYMTLIAREVLGIPGFTPAIIFDDGDPHGVLGYASKARGDITIYTKFTETNLDNPDYFVRVIAHEPCHLLIASDSSRKFKELAASYGWSKSLRVNPAKDSVPTWEIRCPECGQGESYYCKKKPVDVGETFTCPKCDVHGIKWKRHKKVK